jgi:dual specificity phosphatase 12
MSGTARDQIWVNPGFQEQLYLFELCQYAPHPGHGVYQNYRQQIEQRLQSLPR